MKPPSAGTKRLQEVLRPKTTSVRAMILPSQLVTIQTPHYIVIPLSSYGFQQPAFFGAALKDMIALPVFGKATVQAAAKGPVTIREFDGDHWIVLSHADEINRELSAWLEEHKI